MKDNIALSQFRRSICSTIERKMRNKSQFLENIICVFHNSSLAIPLRLHSAPSMTGALMDLINNVRSPFRQVTIFSNEPSTFLLRIFIANLFLDEYCWVSGRVKGVAFRVDELWSTKGWLRSISSYGQGVTSFSAFANTIWIFRESNSVLNGVHLWLPWARNCWEETVVEDILKNCTICTYMK